MQTITYHPNAVNVIVLQNIFLRMRKIKWLGASVDRGSILKQGTLGHLSNLGPPTGSVCCQSICFERLTENGFEAEVLSECGVKCVK